MTFVADNLKTAFVSRDPLFSERVLICEDRFEEAIGALAHRIRHSPHWAEPWAVLGLAFSLAGRFDESLSAVEQALAIEPHHAFAQELKTGLLLHLGLHQQAVEAADRLVALLPDRAESHAFSAFAHSFAGNERDAMFAARQSQALAPNRAIGHQALCVANLAFHRWSDAEHHGLMALSLERPSASTLHDLGVAFEAQGKHEQAAKAFAAAAQLDSRFGNLGHDVPAIRASQSVIIALIITLLSGLALLTVVRSQMLFVCVSVIGIASLAYAILRRGTSPYRR